MKKGKAKEGEHFYISGITGMGKTFLIKSIINHLVSLQPYMNVYHVDSKKQGDFSVTDGEVILSEYAPTAYKKETGKRMVWQPLYDDIKQYDKFFMSILEAGQPAIVNIDECINMIFNGRMPRGLSILATQGRKPGIWVLGGSQQVAKTPRELLSQAKHIISFNMTNRYDVNSMKYLLNMEEKGARLDLKEHEFYYKKTTDTKPRKFNKPEDLLQLIK